MSEQVFLILLSLARGPLHGYAILTETEALSEGRVRLSTGTLYGALKRLLDAAWIAPAPEADAPRDRVAYRLTPEGRAQLKAESRRIGQLAGVSARLGFGGAK